MHFGEVDIKKGCANFARLWGQTPFFILLGKEYARSRGMDEEECVRLVLHYRRNSGTDIVANIRSSFSWIFNG